jgi:hypothetical protein
MDDAANKHYSMFFIDEEGRKVDKTNPTQFGRALQQLNIDMIDACSPDA